jgi:hypothetical protein
MAKLNRYGFLKGAGRAETFTSEPFFLQNSSILLATP